MGEPKDTEKIAPVVGAEQATSSDRSSAVDLDDDEFDEITVITAKTDLTLSLSPTSKDRNRPSLVVLGGLNAGQLFSLSRAETVIGRGGAAQVRLVDAGVSREHARILHTSEGRFFLEDLGSTNGSYVAGEQIKRAELRPGDRFQLGPKVVLLFQVMDAEEERLARQLYDSSTRDALTRVYNRKYFAERLATETAYAIRHKTQLGVIIFDVDEFKRLNDTYGHPAGDEILRTIAARISRIIRAEDVLARFGGEEFVIIARGIEHANVARFAERVRATVEQVIVPWEGKMLSVSISAGVASLGERPEVKTGEALIRAADERLYRAKKQGRNRVVA